jgi:hypothetical protein
MHADCAMPCIRPFASSTQPMTRRRSACTPSAISIERLSSSRPGAWAGLPGHLQQVAHQVALHGRAFGAGGNSLHQRQPGRPFTAGGGLHFNGRAHVVVEGHAMGHAQRAFGHRARHAPVRPAAARGGPAPAAGPGCRVWRRLTAARRRRGCRARSSPAPPRRAAPGCLRVRPAGRAVGVDEALQQRHGAGLAVAGARRLGQRGQVPAGRPAKPLATRFFSFA